MSGYGPSNLGNPYASFDGNFPSIPGGAGSSGGMSQAGFDALSQGAGLAMKIPMMLADRRNKKKARKAQKKEAQYQTDQQLTENLQNQGYMLEDLGRAQGGAKADVESMFNTAGNTESSYEQDVDSDFNRERTRRLDALSRERAAIRHGREFASRMSRIQAQREKLERIGQYAQMGIQAAQAVATGGFGVGAPV